VSRRASLPLLIAVTLVTFTGLSRSDAQALPDAARERLMRVLARSVVDLLVGTDGTATGFFVAPSGWVVTSAAVTHEGPARIRFASGTIRSSHVVRVDEDHGLAILAAEGPPPVPGLSLGDTIPIHVGTSLFVFRAPAGVHGTLVAGHVRSRLPVSPLAGPLTRDVIEMEPGSGSGSEGAPVVDRTGAVLGVIAGGSDDVEHVIPSRYVRDLIASLP